MPKLKLESSMPLHSLSISSTSTDVRTVTLFVILFQVNPTYFSKDSGRQNFSVCLARFSLA
uniref:Uncharacterized protein n=1 Tax=Zea mays TaxID=4577 RepID=B4FPD5_MAIZE|nr:unknown [Zea mays]